MKNDTIVAISTPRGVGGVAVVRLSGPQAKELALRHLSTDTLAPRHSHFTRFSDSEGMIDEVLAVWFPAPHSYTGEEMVEISCHGSLYVQQAIVQSLLDDGARLAEAGEFTLRAFTNGTLNRSQAEAVADLIDAVTPAQHRLAVSQLRGGYAQTLRELRQQLLDLTSLLELELDFSQEDVEFADRRQLVRLVDTLSIRINELRSTFQQGNALKRGIPVAIVGRPNAGKSSLLNALLNDNRAIVSPIPGTTRDTIEETFTADGVTFRIIDTAGLRRSDDPLEAMGVRRTLAAVVQSDIILFVYDITEPFSQVLDDVQEIQDAYPIKGKHLFLVANKADLVQEIKPFHHIAVSAKESVGIDRLKGMLVKVAGQANTDDVILTNARHYEALGRVDQALRQVALGLQTSLPSDLVAIDLRDALYHLGTITGEVANDEVLTNIFSRFCIGK